VAVSQISVNKPQKSRGYPHCSRRPQDQRHDRTSTSLESSQSILQALICVSHLQIEKAFQKQYLFQNAKVRGASAHLATDGLTFILDVLVYLLISWQEDRNQGEEMVQRCRTRVQDTLRSHQWHIYRCVRYDVSRQIWI
jgi:hypothetical protein